MVRPPEHPHHRPLQWAVAGIIIVCPGQGAARQAPATERRSVMRLVFVPHLLLIVIAVGCEGAPRTSKPAALPAPTTRTEAAELRQRITQGRWTRRLANQDRYVYTFAPDGTYANQLHSDFGAAPVAGRWDLKRDASGNDRLLLQGHEPQGDYYWLGPDSVIRFDDATGDLLVSGSRYVGEQRLRHEP